MPNDFHQKLVDLLKEDDSLLDEGGELISATIHRRAAAGHPVPVDLFGANLVGV